MISFELDVEDLADTRFAVSPLHETVVALRVLRDPGLSALHLPWRRAALAALDPSDLRLLRALVSDRRTLPDVLTPRPGEFAPAFDTELDLVRRAPGALVLRDLEAAHAPDPLPGVLLGTPPDDLRDTICDALRRFWELAVEPHWRQMRLVLEADMTYRARRLALGGARLLFADMHPDLRWRDGVLHIGRMISHHHVTAAGRGLLLMPSVFVHKPSPPLSPDEAPSLAYPCRGVGTLWEPAPPPARSALDALLGASKVRLLVLLAEPLPTVEIARRLRVTPSAVSQQLRILHATGLVSRARDGRQVLYRRTSLGDGLIDP
ncbi:ArsR/SmtB family transcription factor [Actinomadura harenae]|uniref:ArsR family transcriptional regulator n=1 Tax=Actinomadura harenae TaxID=2483351 RepID=A0A3M2LQQ5_9ACTN|nr:ArsR family transcriptional regulator [Actinomadura harenae]RMI37188.1 ArsR family transcriptional regulator [Actinomadura harenae]